MESPNWTTGADELAYKKQPVEIEDGEYETDPEAYEKYVEEAASIPNFPRQPFWKKFFGQK